MWVSLIDENYVVMMHDRWPNIIIIYLFFFFHIQCLIVGFTFSPWIHYNVSAMKKPQIPEKKQNSVTSIENMKSQANHDIYLCYVSS